MSVALRDTRIETGIIPELADTSREGMTPGAAAAPSSEDAGPQPLTPETVNGALKLMLLDAINFVDTELTPVRAKATQYYKGEPFGNEEEGRSSVVMTTLRDVVLTTMPSLMRMFFGTERAVELRPKRADLVDMADQQSEYITMLYRKAPGAMLSTQAALKDGLIRQLGFVKWWWEDMPETSTSEDTGLTAEAIQLLEQEEGVAYTIRRQYTAMDGTPLYDCTVSRQVQRGEARWSAVPPEEVLWTRAARSLEEAGMVCHRQEKRVGDLVAMGFDYDEVVENARSNYELAQNQLNIERNDTTTTLQTDASTGDPSMWKVMLYECYARMDEDGNGFPELRQYYLIGTGHKLLRHPELPEETDPYGKPTDHIPLAVWSPDPEAHTVVGQCPSDWTMDLQRIDTSLTRGLLDSLSLSLAPRTAFQEGQVNLTDLLNPEVGGLIRTKSAPANALYEFRHSFVGDDVLPVMQYMKQVREERTGKPMEASGLNADALQSSTREGVMATLTAAQERTELMGRFFAEQLLVPLFRGLYRLTKQHQDYERLVRMRGGFVPIDPRTWDDDCEVEVTLMLGGGMPEQKLSTLQTIIAKQEQLLQSLGPSNPIVTLDQYTAALIEATELAGRPDATRYFTPISRQDAAQLAAAASQQPKPTDPQTTMAQAQVQAMMLDAQTKQAQLQLDQQKFAFQQQFQMEQLHQQFVLGMAEIEAKYGARTQETDVRRMLDEERMVLDTQRHAHETAVDAAVAVHKIETDAAVKREATHVKAHTDVLSSTLPTPGAAPA